MRLLKQIIVGILMFQLIFVLSPQQAAACDCDIPDNAIEGLEAADAVFTGKVKKMKRTSINGEAHDAALIKVNEIWKGFSDSEIIIYTDWTSCQYEFVEGEEYLLYSYQKNDKYFVINCSRSTVLSNAEEDLEQLGPGKEPSKIVNLSFKFIPAWIFGLTIAVVIIMVVFFGLNLVRKNKR